MAPLARLSSRYANPLITVFNPHWGDWGGAVYIIRCAVSSFFGTIMGLGELFGSVGLGTVGSGEPLLAKGVCHVWGMIWCGNFGELGGSSVSRHVGPLRCAGPLRDCGHGAFETLMIALIYHSMLGQVMQHRCV